MAYAYQRQATFVLALTLLGATTWDYSRGFNSFAVPKYDERVNSTSVEPRVYHFFHETIRVWPISFSAPEDIWVPVVQYKIRGFGHIIPGNQSTYIYDSEESYYQDYRCVFFFQWILCTFVALNIHLYPKYALQAFHVWGHSQESRLGLYTAH